VHNWPVPELPEVQALTRALSARSVGRRIERCELASFAALKTVATIDVGPQAAGIDFWKMEPSTQ